MQLVQEKRAWYSMVVGIASACWSVGVRVELHDVVLYGVCRDCLRL